MGERFPYREWLSKIDTTDSEKTMTAIKELIVDEKFDDKQKLVALGLLLEENKEKYISKLKAIIGNQETIIKYKENKIKQMLKIINNNLDKPNKEKIKKFIVVRHKK